MLTLMFHWLCSPPSAVSMRSCLNLGSYRGGEERGGEGRGGRGRGGEGRRGEGRRRTETMAAQATKSIMLSPHAKMSPPPLLSPFILPSLPSRRCWCGRQCRTPCSVSSLWEQGATTSHTHIHIPLPFLPITHLSQPLPWGERGCKGWTTFGRPSHHPHRGQQWPHPPCHSDRD